MKLSILLAIPRSFIINIRLFGMGARLPFIISNREMKMDMI